MIVEYLRKERRVSTIGLWGRSMGAVTSLLHGDRDPSIAGMVLDSPFADMK
jgi:dienelactone hydrolase